MLWLCGWKLYLYSGFKLYQCAVKFVGEVEVENPHFLDRWDVFNRSL